MLPSLVRHQWEPEALCHGPVLGDDRHRRRNCAVRRVRRVEQRSRPQFLEQRIEPTIAVGSPRAQLLEVATLARRQITDVAAEIRRNRQRRHLRRTQLPATLRRIQWTRQRLAPGEAKWSTRHHASHTTRVGTPDFAPDRADLCRAHPHVVHAFGETRDWLAVEGVARPASDRPRFDLVACERERIGTIPNFVGILDPDRERRHQAFAGELGKCPYIRIIGPIRHVDPWFGAEQVRQLNDQLNRWNPGPAIAPQRVVDTAALGPWLRVEHLDRTLKLHEAQCAIWLECAQQERMEAQRIAELLERVKRASRARRGVGGIGERRVTTDSAGRQHPQIAQVIGGINLADTNAQQRIMLRRNTDHIATRAPRYDHHKRREIIVYLGMPIVADDPITGRHSPTSTIEQCQGNVREAPTRPIAKRDHPTMLIEHQITLFAGIPGVATRLVALRQPRAGGRSLIHQPQHLGRPQFTNVGPDR